jgi:hypothetical protein
LTYLISLDATEKLVPAIGPVTVNGRRWQRQKTKKRKAASQYDEATAEDREGCSSRRFGEEEGLVGAGTCLLCHGCRVNVVGSLSRETVGYELMLYS